MGLPTPFRRVIRVMTDPASLVCHSISDLPATQAVRGTHKANGPDKKRAAVFVRMLVDLDKSCLSGVCCMKNGAS